MTQRFGATNGVDGKAKDGACDIGRLSCMSAGVCLFAGPCGAWGVGRRAEATAVAGRRRGTGGRSGWCAASAPSGRPAPRPWRPVSRSRLSDGPRRRNGGVPPGSAAAFFAPPPFIQRGRLGQAVPHGGQADESGLQRFFRNRFHAREYTRADGAGGLARGRRRRSSRWRHGKKYFPAGAGQVLEPRARSGRADTARPGNCATKQQAGSCSKGGACAPSQSFTEASSRRTNSFILGLSIQRTTATMSCS